MMRAMYRIWGKDGHRQKASWQSSTRFETYDGYTIETWCFDRTGSHDYVDVEITHPHCQAFELYDELDAQLDDGIFECCNYGKVEKLKYTYYWTSGCPNDFDFNGAVAGFEKMLNEYGVDGPIIPYIRPGMKSWYRPVFSNNRFTARLEEYWK